MEHIFTTLGIVWNEELSKQTRIIIDDYLHKKENNLEISEEEKNKYNELIDLFETYQCAIDSFATWEDYSRFVTTFAPDFLGIG